MENPKLEEYKEEELIVIPEGTVKICPEQFLPMNVVTPCNLW